jgi:hypothetical protein
MIKANYVALMDEVRERLTVLTRNLPTMVEAAAVSTRAKIPFNALCCREALIWRAEELGRGAFESFARDDVVAGILLTRGLTETVAAMWYLKDLIERQITEGVETDLAEQVMRLLMGHRNVSDMPQAVNILKCIDRAEKMFPGFRESYDAMSEFAHPNWAGSAAAYSKIAPEAFTVHFGRGLHESRRHNHFGANCLVGALATLEVAYNGIAGVLPKFIEVCEAALLSKPEGTTLS